MADHTAILNQHWTDILPPSPPAPMGWWLIFSAVVLALLVVLVVALLWQQRPRQRALRQLRRCYQQLQSLSADSRDVAYRVYLSVQQGLAIHPVNTSGAGACDPHWQDFYHKLQTCVFGARVPERDEVADLIRQGRYWLKHYGNE